HVLAAQSSDGDPGGTNTQADAHALSYLRAALASLDLSKIGTIEIFSMDQSGNPKLASDGTNSTITKSADFTTAPASPVTLTLDNIYTYGSPPTNPPCPVDQFYLSNPATSASTAFLPCSLPWNGGQWAKATNQNGRHDQRCDEETVGVKITYNYAAVSWPFVFKLTLQSQDSTTMEPRQFLGSAPYQATIGACP
ncbi:MAG: hypothetical protein JWO59_3469, partial [Chloroflexi bacterium]|nr:hypothetical protein [Chloroflexota bacterium]